jgi:hypothetical protein
MTAANEPFEGKERAIFWMMRRIRLPSYPASKQVFHVIFAGTMLTKAISMKVKGL